MKNNKISLNLAQKNGKMKEAVRREDSDFNRFFKRKFKFNRSC